MSDGFPAYGINCHKFTTNFGESHNTKELVFCGIRLISHGEVKSCHKLTPDVSTYQRQNIAYSVNFQTFQASNRDQFMVKKTRFLPNIKMQSAFLDESINGRTQTLTNLFVIHYINVLRLHAVLDSVYFSQGIANQPGDIVSNLFSIFIEKARRSFAQVAKRLSNRTVRVIHSELMMILAIRNLIQKQKATQYCTDLKKDFGSRIVKPEFEAIARHACEQYQLNKIVARAYQKL